VKFTKERKAFGKTVFEFQNTRFTLADLATKLQVGWAHLDWAIKRHIAGELTAAEASAAKLWHTEFQFEGLRRVASAARRRRLHERISHRPTVARRPRHPHLRRHQ
jgi:alkylation response protein AidB-like acyl-CoA dehydrogenase